MKRLLKLLAFSSQLLALCTLRAEMPIDDAQLTGTANQVKTGATLTVQSGATLAVSTGGTATAPAWFLDTFTASTITTGQNGLGWDENGRVTLQTPVGALQFYETGSPLESVIYWPGRIVTGSIDAGTLTGSFSASSITAPTGFESINTGIIARSLLSPMSEWMGLEAYAGANGVPYVTDAQGAGGSLEATDGVYFPQAVVSGQSAGTSSYLGRYRTAAQVKTDLALATVATSGAYADLTGQPSLFSGSAADLTGTMADARLSANVPLLSAANTFTGATQTAPAWLLPTFTASTISTGQTGLGWDENGRVTLQTPVGALQFYATGSPSESVIYWPGRIVTGSIDAGTLTGSFSASSITAPTGFESINTGIIARSLLSPMSEWMGLEAYAGANGVPYVTDAQGAGGSLEATDGVYFPQAVVSGQSAGTSSYLGRYRTAAQVKTDLALATVATSGAYADLTGQPSLFSGSAADLTGTLDAARLPAQTTASVRTVTANATILSTNAVIICTGAGGITLTLPPANANTPRVTQLEIINRTTGNVVLARVGSDLFEGFTTATISSGSSWSITSDASANWYLY